MYKNSLDSLRQEVFSLAVAEPEKPKKSGLIQARVESPVLSEPKITPYSDWLRTISQMASEIKKSSPKQSAEGSFVEGFSSALSKKDEPKVQEEVSVLESNKEALIKRRGSGPSYYAPRPSEPGSFEELIDKTEGGGDYDALFGFSNREGKAFEGVRVSEMTIGELKAFANGEYGAWSRQQLGYKATPMGRYQFVGSTLSSVAKEMGLPDDTVFSPKVQDEMFNYWLRKTAARGKSLDEKVALLRGQWEGFKKVDSEVLKSAILKHGV